MRPHASGPAGSVVSRWQQPLFYVQEQVLMFEIDQLLWPSDSSVRQQVWPLLVSPKWTGPLRDGGGFGGCQRRVG